MIDASNYRQRRAALAKTAGVQLIVLTGSDLIQKSSDETYEFEQDGYFKYLTGIDEPGWILVMDVARGSEFLISTDESSYHNEAWEVKLSQEELVTTSGVTDIKNRRDGWAYLRYQTQNYQSIGSLVPKMRFSRPFGMYLNPAKTMLVERLRRIYHDANLIDISAAIRRLRSVKDDDEITAIRQAIKITKQGFDAIVPKLNEFRSELEIYTELTHEYMAHGATHGYTPVIATGANAAKIHYKKNTDRIAPNGLLLIDTGARINSYSADITRTYQLGVVTERQKQIMAAVMDAYEQAIDFVGPGVTLRACETNIEQIIGKHLMDLGIIKTMLRQDIRRYYPHALSHHLGLDIHDSCDYEMELQPGAVITVEPGIYLSDEGIGVRHEEDVLITKDGVEVLTAGIGMQT